MSVSWILLFVFINFAAPFKLRCPSQTVEAEADKTVILPCFTVLTTDIRGMEWTVEWVINGTHDVHVYRQQEDNKQSDDYAGRTSLPHANLNSGNCSLSLRVKMDHVGTYMCSVRRSGSLVDKCSIKLIVTEAKGNHSHHISEAEPTISPKVIVSNGLKIGVGLGVGLIALVMVGALCKKYAVKEAENQNTQEEQTKMIKTVALNTPAEIKLQNPNTQSFQVQSLDSV